MSVFAVIKTWAALSPVRYEAEGGVGQMGIRQVARRVINALGYDIHRQIKDAEPFFDPAHARVTTATFDAVSACFFVADDRDTIQSHHAEGRFFEPDILVAIAERFAPSGVYVDIGANVGNHVVYMAKRYPEARLIGFEPMQRQHAIFVVNALLNELATRLVIHKTAASDHSGKAQMITPNVRNLGRSMIANAGYGEWVDLAPADDILAGQEINFIKIDVEGHELGTLAGLEKTIRRCRPTMLIEVNEANREAFDAWMRLMDYQIDVQFKHNSENFEVIVVPAPS